MAAYSSNLEAERDAKDALFEAAYRQTGTEKNINSFLEKRIPEDLKPTVAKVTAIVRVVVTKKVEAKWNF